MTEREISQILLVRSVEECDPDFFTPDNQLNALIISGAEESDAALIQKRAHYLFHKLPDMLKDVPQTLHLSHKWILLLFIGVFFLGIGVNYLGPGDKIHVIYNPVVLLILWNIGVFAFFLIRHFFLKEQAGHAVESFSNKKQPQSAQSGEPDVTPPEPVKPGRASSSHWIFRKIWFSFHKQILKKKHDVKQIASSVKITSRYMELWWDMNQHVLLARVTRLVHVLAVCLILGALAGIYIRGLFFEYNVIWKSTFIHDLNDIALILNIIFGIPSQVLHGTFIDAAGINLLTSPTGEPAAPWIHLFAVSAFILVIPTRFLLMFLGSRRIKALSKRMTVNSDEHYYARAIKLAQEMQADRLQEEIAIIVQSEISRLSESIALYVREGFYDKKVVPQLIHFRDNGGRIRNLEDAISKQSEDFTMELNSFLATIQEDFKQSLSEGVSGVIGKKLSAIELNVENEIRVNPDAYREALDGTVTYRMTSGISLAVTAAVAATIGTLSGGFGKVLGIAVVSTLLHTTGPVGFIIGALAGLLLGGGASVLVKDKITDVVKNQSFPAFSTRVILRESKMNKTVEEGRIQVYNLIKTQIEHELTPYTDEITNQILSKIAIVMDKR